MQWNGRGYAWIAKRTQVPGVHKRAGGVKWGATVRFRALVTTHHLPFRATRCPPTWPMYQARRGPSSPARWSSQLMYRRTFPLSPVKDYIYIIIIHWKMWKMYDGFIVNTIYCLCYNTTFLVTYTVNVIINRKYINVSTILENFKF